MEYKQRIEDLRNMYEELLKKVKNLDPSNLPESVDKEKLEKAYDALKGYRWVLKKM